MLTVLYTLTVQCVINHYCADTTTTFVAVVPPPDFLIQDTVICFGDTISVEQPNISSYLWNTGSMSPYIVVDSAGTYNITMITNQGCKKSNSFNVSFFNDLDVDFGNDSILCGLATLFLDASQSHPAQYLWQDLNTNKTYTVVQDGDFWVVVTDNCMKISDSIHIDYLSDFSFSLGNDTILCDGRTLILSPNVQNCDYLWQDGSNNTQFMVNTAGIYSVDISNICFSHYDEISVDFENCDDDILLPNAFSPDNDGNNDVFVPIFNHPYEIEDFSMEIYDRWGILVFKSDNIKTEWDGGNFPAGVYACKIYYKMRGKNAQNINSSIILIR